MDNLISITPNCFIVRSQAGFKKLCSLLGCNESKNQYNYNYRFEVHHYTNDKNAIEDQRTCLVWGCDGKGVFDENGIQKTYTITNYKQYPIKYPCIISFQDQTFECGRYIFYIKYVFDDLRIKDFISAIDIKDLMSRYI